MRRDGGVLIVAVLERPTIESFEVKGNKDIKTEDLERSLRNVGLSAGKTFDQSVLDEVRQYLTEQYFSRGKYAREGRRSRRRGAGQPRSRSRSTSPKASAPASSRSTSPAISAFTDAGS